MMMFGFPGWMELLMISLMTAGGTGLPLGLPPGETDPLLAKIAPEECTFYVSWSGMATPDPKSENHVEQLLAEEEVQRLVKHLDKAITAAILADADDEGPERALAEEVPKIVKAMLTRPAAAFVGKVGFALKGVELDGGIIVNTGDQTEELKKVVARIEDALGDEVREVEIGEATWKEFPMPEGAPRMVWGFRGKYMVLATGKSAVEGIFTRAQSPPPAWLAEIREQLTVERPGSLLYVNTRKVLDLAFAFSPNNREARAIASVLGFDNVEYLASVTGLEGPDCVTRQLVAMDETPTGLFTLADGKPLGLADLAPIPQDSTFALAARLDGEKIYREFLEALGKLSPEVREEFEREIVQGESELGIRLSDDVLKPLGDTWRIYNSPSQGGLLFTGLTAVVSLRDRAKVVATLEKIEKLAQAEAQQAANPGGRPRRHVTIDHFQQGDEKIYFVNFIGAESPFAPAWCATEKELIVSLFPSQVKAYLARGEDFQSITAVPQVAAAFGKRNPAMFAYQDTREMFKLTYPILQILAQFACSEAQRAGVEIDISMLPSAPVIARHLQPDTTKILRTDAGIELESRQSLPMSLNPLPVLLPMFLFGMRIGIDAPDADQVRLHAPVETANQARHDARNRPFDALPRTVETLGRRAGYYRGSSSVRESKETAE